MVQRLVQGEIIQPAGVITRETFQRTPLVVAGLALKTIVGSRQTHSALHIQVTGLVQRGAVQPALIHQGLQTDQAEVTGVHRQALIR